ncbi:hypothetical protein ALI22I_09515 [Saccharothrix sp. ALI-22-I]|nr:hypothetical protein ALI22I_09515 [Saccharothrix sp. ALI-22-I]
MDLVIDPPRAVGPLRIGMPFDEAVELLRSLDGYRSPSPGHKSSPGFAHYESELTISLGPDRDGRVKAVDLYRPERDVTVLFGDIAVFDTPADEVIRRLSDITRLEVEGDGTHVVAPDLLLALARPFRSDSAEEHEGWYFESVLVAAPGYYDS